MKCIMLQEEIDEEECLAIIEECYKKKNGKELPKKVKRVSGWNIICKACKFHKVPKKK